MVKQSHGGSATFLPFIEKDTPYIRRPELETEIRNHVQQLHNSSSRPAVFFVIGDGGVGKTTILQHVLEMPSFLLDCGFSTQIWLNFSKISKSANIEEAFCREIHSMIVGQHYSWLFDEMGLKSLLETKFSSPTSEILLIIDNVNNSNYEKIFACLDNFRNYFRAIFVSRNLPIKLPSIHVDQLPEPSIKRIFHLRAPTEHQAIRALQNRASKCCKSLPFLAQIVAARLRSQRTLQKANSYVKQLEQIQYPATRHEETEAESESAIRKVLLADFDNEPPDERRKLYALLLFDECSTFDIKDLSILWQCKEGVAEAKCFCLTLCKKSLIRCNNKDQTLFSLNSQMYSALLDFAINYETTSSNADLTNGLKQEASSSTTEALLAKLRKRMLASKANVLHLAIKHRRWELIDVIYIRTHQDRDADILFKLCCMLSPSPDVMLPLQSLLEIRWPKYDNMIALVTACELANCLLSNNLQKGLALLFIATKGSSKSTLDLLLANAKAMNNCKWQQNAVLISANSGYRPLLTVLAERAAETIKNCVDETGKTALMIACVKGDELTCNLLLQTKSAISIDAKDTSGNTALLLAVKHGKLPIAKQIIQAGADVKVRNKEGNSALWYLLLCNAVELAKMVHGNGATLTSSELAVVMARARLKRRHDIVRFLAEWQQSHRIAELSDVDFESVLSPICRLLEIDQPPKDSPAYDFLRHIYQNDDVNGAKEQRALIGDNMASSALKMAVYYGRAKCVTYLLDKFGVDVNAKIDRFANTFLIFAAENGHFHVVQTLLAKGADVNAKTVVRETALFCACTSGHLEVLKLLLDHNADVNSKLVSNTTPLWTASFEGHLDVVMLLLDRQADVNAANVDGFTALFAASQQGHVRIVEQLLARNACVTGRVESNTSSSTINAKESQTALWIACHLGHLNVAKLLLENGADADSRRTDGVTTLFTASARGHLEIVRTLLSHKVDVNAATVANGSTPLIEVCQFGHAAIVKELLANGANVNAKRKDGCTGLWLASQFGHLEIVKLLLDNKESDLDNKCLDETTALHIASQAGHAKIVEMLLEHKANINALKTNNITPLMLAAFSGKSEIVTILVGNGADIHVKSASDDYSALHLASLGNHVEVAKILIIDGKAEIAGKDKDGCSPLHLAVANGSGETAKLLIAHDANVNARSNSGGTPLYAASARGLLEVIEMLLERNADVKMRATDGSTPLHYACQEGHVEVVKKLVAHNADINAKRINNMTPLMMAVSNGRIDVVKYLLDSCEKVDIESVNASGQTALAIAVEQRQPEIVALLKKNESQRNRSSQYFYTLIFLLLHLPVLYAILLK